MSDTKAVLTEISVVVTRAMHEMHDLAKSSILTDPMYAELVSNFILGLLYVAANLGESVTPGTGGHIYALLEKGVKEKGLEFIRNKQIELGGRAYSVSDLAPDDFEGAMNYLGNELSVSLFKHIHDLPLPLRTPEMPLRAMQALMANVLYDKFQMMCHEILDQLCQNTHLCLSELERQAQSKRMTPPEKRSRILSKDECGKK